MKIGTNKNLTAFLFTGRTYSLSGEMTGWRATLAICYKPKTARGGVHGESEEVVVGSGATEESAIAAAKKALPVWLRELGLKAS